ncbi:hypothetical protein Q7P37_003969 [Cladosporium fusiforme]
MRSFTTAAVALSLGSTTLAQLSKECFGEVCYQLNIPQSTADSGSGDIFIQMSAPTDYEWVGLGQGSSMSGANIFIMYKSADGNNVTVSPRSGSGHNEPSVNSNADISLLEGSGVEGNTMTANIRCGSCDSWSGGSMDFSSSSASWIHATASGSTIQSDSLDESLSQHGRDYGSFDWDFSNAKGGSEVNPLLSSSGTSNSGSSTGTASSGGATCTPAPSKTLASVTGTSGCPTAWPTEYSTSWPSARPTWAADCHPEGYGPGGRGPNRDNVAWPTDAPWRENDKRDLPECDGDDDGSSSSSGSSSSNLSQNSRSGAFGGASRETIILAHGVMAALVFVGLLPIGGILIRVASFTGLLWVHAALQILGFILYIVAFAMGVILAMNSGYLSEAHPIIGIVLLVLLFVQPLGGWLHHRAFKKHGRRTTVSFAHIGIGRIAIFLGMVNGGLGLKLAGNREQSAIIAYAVVAAVMGFLYLASIFYGERKRKRNLAVPHGHGQPSYRGGQKEMSRHYESSNASYEVPPPPREYYSKRDSRR